MNEDLEEISFLYRQKQKELVEGWNLLPPEKRKLFLSQLRKYDEDLLLRQRSRLFPEREEEPFSVNPLKEVAHSGNTEDILSGKKLISKGKMGCLVLSGGQGTRLGFNGPKGCAPVTLVKQKSLFQFLSEKCAAASEQAKIPLSIAIMTSPLNMQETISFFQQHRYFGLAKEQVDFFSQEMLPFLNSQGNWTLSSSGLIAEGPDGNGGMIKAFYSSKIALKWKKQGIDFVNVILIDNALADPFDAELLGFTSRLNLTAGVKATEKTDPDDSVGVIGTSDGHLSLIEYTDLSDSEKRAVEPDGSLCWKVANLSLFCFSLDFLLDLGSSPSFKLPWHLLFKNSLWKFETFLFDALRFAQKSAVLVYPREECFASLKNREGKDSLETVQKLLLQHDRKIFRTVTGKEPPDLPFELDPHFYYPENWHQNQKYTERDSKIGFGLTRKLPQFDDRKLPNIRNMGQLPIVELRGFGAAEIPIFESRSVYIFYEDNQR